MNTHESVQTILSRAAAGALGEQEQRQVENHLPVCEACRRELDSWSVYMVGLRQLPQPSVPPDLIERTRMRILREREDASAVNWNGLTLGALGAFSWAATIALWIAARAITGGRFEVLGMNLVSAGPWFLASSIVAWTTGGAAALMMSNRRALRRVL